MGKVGSIFRDTRLSKGLTLDQIADETNISKRYLQGIENDTFDGFPGEVYIIGFIRNYAEFLGLNPADIVARFKATELEPEPSDQDESLEEPSSETVQSVSSVEKIPNSQTPIETKPEQRELETPSLFPEEPAEAKIKAIESEPSSMGKKNRKSKKPNSATHPSETKASLSMDSSSAAAGLTLGEKTGLPLSKSQPSLSDSKKEKIAPSPQLPFHKQKKQKAGAAPIQLGRFLLYALAAAIIIIGIASILPRLKLPARTSRAPTDYRAEGLPFEQRLYPQDRVYLPLGNDFISVTLKSVKDKVVLDTPYGEFNLGLNEETIINPTADKDRLIVSIADFAPNEPQNGALARFDAKEALSQQETSNDIIVPANPAATSSRTEPAPVVLFRSSSGPHPFYVNVSIVSPVMFRYEADRKEWVEKYYRKGESITINASNSLTFWTANAQAVKVSVFQSAGKSTEFMMGGPGEISVQRFSWSNSQGGWALVAAPLD